MSYQQLPALSLNAARLVVVTLRPSDADLEEMVCGTNMTIKTFLEGEGYLSWSELHRLMENIIRINHDPGLYLRTGLRAVPTLHGAIGMAAMTSSNVGEALALFQRYMSTRSQIFSMNYEADSGDFSVMSFDFLPDNDEVLRALMESILASAFSCVEFLLGQPISGAEVHLVYPAPAHAGEYQKAFHENVIRFGAERNAVLIPRDYTKRSLLSRDSQMQRLALLQCDATQELFKRSGSMAELILGRLQKEDGRPLTLEQLAAYLNVGRRTLLRRLKDEGTSYQKLLDADVSRRALALMDQPGATITAVAAQLGYSEPASFRRAFRRWFGVTPSKYQGAH